MESRLQKFACIVDQGGFSKAAIKMHISQPALTAAVKKLEKELKVRLLERTNKQIILTEAGQTVYKTAKEIDTNVSNLKQKLLEISKKRPKISLGMTDSMANVFFEQNSQLSNLSKSSDLSLTVNTSAQLTDAISRGELDAAIIVKPQQDLPDLLVSEFLGNEPLLLVVSKKLKDSCLDMLNKNRLSNFLSYNKSSNTKRIIDKELKIRRISTNTSFYSTSPEVILRMLLAGEGPAILPYSMVKKHLESKDSPIYNLSFYTGIILRPIYLIKRSGRELSPEYKTALSSASTTLEELLQEAYRSTASA